MWWVLTVAMSLWIAITLITVNRLFFALGRGKRGARSAARRPRSATVVDLRPESEYQILPHYVDLDVGQSVRVVKSDGKEIVIRVVSVQAESRRYACPLTRVDLEVGGERCVAYCGMLRRGAGGIAPLKVDGIVLGVEITRLVFSKMKHGPSLYNTYGNFRLRGDLRLAIWDEAHGIIRDTAGVFVVDQPTWTRNRFGNWLHITSYGIHSGIDVYPTRNGQPENVLSPVGGTIHGVYNRDVSPDDIERNKTVNIYGDSIVGPGGEKLLYRFLHFSEILVAEGDSVKRGQVIGLTGHTGFHPRIGDHLHFETRLNPSLFGYEPTDDPSATIPVNPYNFLLEWYDNHRDASSG